MKAEINNFLDIYFESFYEIDEEDEKLLGEAGINLEEAEKNILDLIAKRKSVLKIEEGKKFKEKYHSIIKQKIKLILPNLEIKEPELAIAFRKLENKSPEEIDELMDDKMKLALISYLKDSSD